MGTPVTVSIDERNVAHREEVTHGGWPAAELGFKLSSDLPAVPHRGSGTKAGRGKGRASDATQFFRPTLCDIKEG